MAIGAESYLHTTHRTVNWFRKAFEEGELSLSPPYQRQAVWTDLQKAYLVDTILNGLPVPELYMQDVGDEVGREEHIVVDGQQRIRAVLEFLEGRYSLSGADVTAAWRDRFFEELTIDQKKAFYGYKFVVRVLPADLRDNEIRSIFSRIKKNVVNLNDQELRNATYSGGFISVIQEISNEEGVWSPFGVFTANDHRRMLDQEFISELAIAFLHGAQNKKDKVDHYYIQYEEAFDRGQELKEVFYKTARELNRTLPDLRQTRWRKKSDFYTMFLEFALRHHEVPFDQVVVDQNRNRILQFGQYVDEFLRLDDEDRQENDPNVAAYARGVARAASDRGSRVERAHAFSQYVFGEPSTYGVLPKREQGG